MPIGDRNDAQQAAQLIQLLPPNDPRRAQLLERITAWDAAEHSNVPPGLRSGATRTGSPGQPAGVMQQATSGPLEQLGAGITRKLDYWSKGLQQMFHQGAQTSPAYQTADPEQAQRLGGDQGLERQGQMFTRDARHQERLFDIASQEKVARELYERIDSQEGIFGTTIGLEDIGEMIPDAVAFIGSGGESLPAQMAQLGTRAALVGAAGATTEEESRIQNTIMSGVFGAAFPGLLRGADAVLRNTAFFTKFTLGALGSVAGIRGMGRATTIFAKVGGEARRMQLNAGDALRLREIASEAAERLAPVIEKLNRHQVQDVQRRAFRDLLVTNFRKYSDPTLAMKPGARPGLDVTNFVRELEGMAPSTIRNRIGNKEWGDNVNALVEFAHVVGPEFNTILQRGLAKDDGIRGMVNAITDYVGAGSFRAIRSMKNPTERRLAHLRWWNRMAAATGLKVEEKEDVPR